MKYAGDEIASAYFGLLQSNFLQTLKMVDLLDGFDLVSKSSVRFIQAGCLQFSKCYPSRSIFNAPPALDKWSYFFPNAEPRWAADGSKVMHLITLRLETVGEMSTLRQVDLVSPKAPPHPLSTNPQKDIILQTLPSPSH